MDKIVPRRNKCLQCEYEHIIMRYFIIAIFGFVCGQYTPAIIQTQP